MYIIHGLQRLIEGNKNDGNKMQCLDGGDVDDIDGKYLKIVKYK